MDVEDILNDALPFDPDGVRIDPTEEGVVRYGPLALRVAAKEGKANTLLADHLFNPALVIAERIERGLLPLDGATVLELGAGAALPSLLAAHLRVPRLVVVTDYPDSGIMGNVMRNVQANAVLADGVDVRPIGYEWGTDVSELLSLLPVESTGYDVLILSDLLHFHTSHSALISSISALLPRTAKSRAYVGAGKYTSEAVCDDWVHAAHVAGLEMEEVQDDNTWTGRMEVVWSGTRLDERALTERKGNCRLWIGRWKGV